MTSIIPRLKYLWRLLVSGALGQSPGCDSSVLPDGLKIRTLAKTGVIVIDNFCSPAEAAAVIAVAKDKLKRSQILTKDGFVDSDERRSYTAHMCGKRYAHPLVVPLMKRAGALVGLPITHLEDVYVTRYREAEFYGQHIDFGDAYGVDRLYTVLLYLNSVPEGQGGATVFPTLKAAAQPVVGRAVTWTNKNPDGSGHLETNHAAYPVRNGGEKWVIQFWFRRYRMLDSELIASIPAAPVVHPLHGDELLPEGVHYNNTL